MVLRGGRIVTMCSMQASDIKIYKTEIHHLQKQKEKVDDVRYYKILLLIQRL